MKTIALPHQQSNTIKINKILFSEHILTQIQSYEYVSVTEASVKLALAELVFNENHCSASTRHVFHIFLYVQIICVLYILQEYRPRQAKTR